MNRQRGFHPMEPAYLTGVSVTFAGQRGLFAPVLAEGSSSCPAIDERGVFLGVLPPPFERAGKSTEPLLFRGVSPPAGVLGDLAALLAGHHNRRLHQPRLLHAGMGSGDFGASLGRLRLSLCGGGNPRLTGIRTIFASASRPLHRAGMQIELLAASLAGVPRSLSATRIGALPRTPAARAMDDGRRPDAKSLTTQLTGALNAVLHSRLYQIGSYCGF